MVWYYLSSFCFRYRFKRSRTVADRLVSGNWVTSFWVCSSNSHEVRAVEGGICSFTVLSSWREALTRFHHSAEYLGTPLPEYCDTITLSVTVWNFP